MPMHPFIQREIAHTHACARDGHYLQFLRPSQTRGVTFRQQSVIPAHAAHNRELPAARRPHGAGPHVSSMRRGQATLLLYNYTRDDRVDAEIVLRKRIQRGHQCHRITTEGPHQGVGEIAIETVFFATSNTGRYERRLHVVVVGGWTTSGAQRARVQKTVQWARNKKDTPGGSGHLESTRNAARLYEAS
jgi:hypothetical protein